ncbi:enoyl-CoA hydratase/isomerase family protein [Nocardioides marmoriginsengisoli]|uniref:Enoyl-CoA hydratase/isomerase family protein n=1 Tax=Nocardioides marmoriginsengisoli TaxID=661483 RepID=A0A3N0CH47_9ACTN|nr:enoyl-CoA hydratase/isomerase family protein [Nocardioides marmoriginsengisoli]RNL62777.1 enoyl-CoA hydratase/isomerase family protein [Nocardioides marmoriginsengisoli]
MTAFTEITTTVAAGVGTIHFNRFDRRHALSLEVFADLSYALDAWRHDDEVACVVITGGEDVFCAGLDLKLQSVFTNQQTRDEYSAACLRAYGTLLDYGKPTIAAVGGPALGGGCDIAVFCDIRIGATNTVMGFPQIKMGLTPYFSPLWKIVGLSQAKLLTFSGDKIDAAEALRIGLLDRMVEAGSVVAEATRIARSIAETTAESAANNKEMALRSPAMDPISALTYETLAYREVIWRPHVVERIGKAYSALRK